MCTLYAQNAWFVLLCKTVDATLTLCELRRALFAQKRKCAKKWALLGQFATLFADFDKKYLKARKRTAVTPVFLSRVKFMLTVRG